MKLKQMNPHILRKLVTSPGSFFATLSTFFLFVSILIPALLLRLPLLNSSFWLDEAAQAMQVTRPWHQQLSIAEDFQPPLLHLLLHLVQYVSHAEWWLRIFGALIPGLVSIWFAILVIRKISGLKNSLWIGLFLATNSLHVFFSQELRPYALPAACASVSWWILLNWLDKKSPTKILHLERLGFFFALATIAGLYSSYLYPFLLLGQLFYLIWYKQSKRLVLPLLFVIVCMAPWLPYFLNQLSVGSQLRVALPGWDQVVSIPQWKALALIPAKFIFGVVELNLLSVLSITLTSGVVSGLILLRFLVRHPFQSFLSLDLSQVWSKNILLKKSAEKLLITRAQLLSISWFLIPFLSSWLVSWIIPVVSPKRLLFALPAFYLLLLHLPWISSKKILQQWLCMTLVCIQLAGLSLYWTQPLYQRENWRELEKQIHSTYPTESTVLLFGFTGPFSPWTWYHDLHTSKGNCTPKFENNCSTRFNSISSGYLVSPEAKIALPDALKQVTEYEFVLVFDYLRDLTDPDDLLLKQLEEFGFEGIGVIDYTNIGFIRIYTKPANILGYTGTHQ